MYMLRKQGDELIYRLKEYIKKSKERLITVANNSCGNKSADGKTTKARKQKWKEKQVYGYFK